MQKKQKKRHRFLKVFGVITVSLLTVLILLLTVSPAPSTWFFARAFNGPAKITNKHLYSQNKRNISCTSNTQYGSEKDEIADIYTPKNHKTGRVLYWMHGGGFIGGDKSGTKEFATYIANLTSTTVVSLNYTVAPKGRYPTQLQQLAKAVSHFQKKSHLLKTAENSKIYIGGDSAGAQIAAQYVAAQSNSTYAKQLKSVDLGKKIKISGAILYCGPYNFGRIRLEAKKSGSILTQWFVHTIGWAVSGHFFWNKSDLVTEANIASHVSSDFPKTYITDGTRYTFTSSGKELAASLRKSKVPTTTRFFPADQAVSHEYQFQFNSPKAKETLNQTVQFIQSE